MASGVGAASSITLSLNYPYSSTHPKPTSSLRSLSFSSTTSLIVFSTGLISMSPIVRPTRHSIICEAAPNKKADSAAKRARQAEKRRVHNKARKSEVKTRMKKSYHTPSIPSHRAESMVELEIILRRGQGLSMGVLNLAIVIPQIVVSLGSGPLDQLFGGSNSPALAVAAVAAFVGGLIAILAIPRSKPIKSRGHQ